MIAPPFNPDDHPPGYHPYNHFGRPGWMPPPDRWVELGNAPAPETSWQKFCYHVAQGVLMRYPLRTILWFAWVHRGMH